MGPILLIGSRDNAKLYDASYQVTHQSFYGIDMAAVRNITSSGCIDYNFTHILSVPQRSQVTLNLCGL